MDKTFNETKNGRFDAFPAGIHRIPVWVLLTGILLFSFLLKLVCWRLGCHSMMVSSRYASILLYPAVIFTAWSCFFFRDILAWLSRRFNWRDTPFLRRLSAAVPTIYRKIQAPAFYTSAEQLFPTKWWLGVEKAVEGYAPEMALTAKAPIAGIYSLEARAENQRVWGMNSLRIPAQDGVFSGFIRAESDILLQVHSCCWDTEKKQTRYIHNYVFRLTAGKTYRFSFPFSAADVPEKGEGLYLIFQGDGHALLDNIEFIKRKVVL